MMQSSGDARSRRWLVAGALLFGILLAAGLPIQSAQAATTAAPAPLIGVRPFVGCAPCISSLTPAQNGVATADASGKITLSFTAQLTNPFAKFVLTLDNATIDTAQIQVDSADPMQPTGKYTAALSAGAHTATVEVDDTNGAAATFPGWSFTVKAPSAPAPTATKPPAGTGTGTNGGSGNSGATTGSSGFTPKTLSIVLFSIAGLGLLVIVFIAGMWYAGSRELRRSSGNQP